MTKSQEAAIARGLAKRASRENEAEIKGNTQPLKIGASLPVGTIRAAYLDNLLEAIRVGHELFGDGLTDSQIVAIARREATLRGFTPNITYHSEPCKACIGRGHLIGTGDRHIDCPACKGDGFAPPFEGDS